MGQQKPVSHELRFEDMDRLREVEKPIYDPPEVNKYVREYSEKLGYLAIERTFNDKID